MKLEKDLQVHVTQRTSVSQILEDLSEEHRAREDYLRPARAISNRECAIIRRQTGCTKNKAPGILKKMSLGNRETQNMSGLEASINPLEFARQHLLNQGKVHKKRMIALVRQLPIWEWAKSVHGLGEVTFAQIMAETGNPSNYPAPAKYWTRMGLGIVTYPCPKCREKDYEQLYLNLFGEEVYEALFKKKADHATSETHKKCVQPSDGTHKWHDTQPSSVQRRNGTQRRFDQHIHLPHETHIGLDVQNTTKCKKCNGLGFIQERQRKHKDVKLAKLHGYSPTRRAIMWNIGKCLIRSAGPYYELYLTRKKKELLKAPELIPLIHHRRARRWIEKRLLRELWTVWNQEQAEPNASK